MNSIGWVERLTQDLRLALRMIRRNPGFRPDGRRHARLGIGATTAVFSVVNAVLSVRCPIPIPTGWLVSGTPRSFRPSRPQRATVLDDVSDLPRAQRDVCRSSACGSPARPTSPGLGEPEQVRTIVVTHETLPAIGVRPALGRWFSAADDTPGTTETVILTHGYWQRRFAGDGGIARTVLTIDSRPREVIGVMPRTFRFLNAEADVILPQRFEPAPAACRTMSTAIWASPGSKPGVVARSRPTPTSRACCRSGSPSTERTAQVLTAGTLRTGSCGRSSRMSSATSGRCCGC